jgi:hypothetical protein
LKGPILQLLYDFTLGRVDISLLNFEIISLIPKVKGADSIKQFWSIALINVIFKFVVKAFAIRLAPLAHRTIDRSQSAFIKEDVGMKGFSLPTRSPMSLGFES